MSSKSKIELQLIAADAEGCVIETALARDQAGERVAGIDVSR